MQNWLLVLVSFGPVIEISFLITPLIGASVKGMSKLSARMMEK
jgi:hypothetical protein